jgi:hypothetical protein
MKAFNTTHDSAWVLYTSRRMLLNHLSKEPGGGESRIESPSVFLFKEDAEYELEDTKKRWPAPENQPSVIWQRVHDRPDYVVWLMRVYNPPEQREIHLKKLPLW